MGLPQRCNCAPVHHRGDAKKVRRDACSSWKARDRGTAATVA
eukprot:CAMPEP_0203941786 /NCGR_PEP_ID=MMETSP0359-20131031/78119_1 /ASSEMBLY_ACC=CAM_ASM_000338 /TAXON_ID=268821 /ORGANISM="Scrippsiella Hangoei, Strain SHTV-5" /LENGTH=41 /DNA_ID= /DNA_START= /DNA_END= /DNA_ORIENTATION=